MDYEEVKQKAVRGIVALTGRAVFLQAANFLTFNFLAAFLGSINIGIFIAVSAIRDIFNLFIDVGLGAALVQKKEEVTGEELSSTFVMQEILVVLTVLVAFFLTSWVKGYLNLDQAGVVLYWSLLVALLINSLKVIPSILLERKLHFEKQIMPQLVEAIIFDAVVVFLAWRGWGLYAYSWAIVLGALAGLVGYYLIQPWRPSLHWSKRSSVQLVSFGIQFQGKNYLAVVKDQLLTLFLTKAVGFAGIGYWGFAQRWAYSPFRFIVDSVTKVTFPAYARLQHDKDLMRLSLEKSLFIVSLTLFPSLVLISFFGRAFVMLVPRLNQYEPALFMLYVLCLQAGISALSNILVNALDANGRVRTTLGLMVMWVALTWGATVILVNQIGINGIALAQLLVSSTIFLTIYLVNKMVKFSFVGSVIKPTVAVAAMVFSGWITLRLVPGGFLANATAIIFGVLIYCLAILLLARQEIWDNARLLLKVYQK